MYNTYKLLLSIGMACVMMFAATIILFALAAICAFIYELFGIISGTIVTLIYLLLLYPLTKHYYDDIN